MRSADEIRKAVRGAGAIRISKRVETTVLTVVRVHKDADMRGIRKQARSVQAHGLTLELFINKMRTIARLINTEIIITRYAKQGEIFDLPTIESMVASLHLRVTVTGRRVRLIGLAA